MSSKTFISYRRKTWAFTQRLANELTRPARMKTDERFKLPPPFAWVDIPAGQVTLEDDIGTFDVPAFQIAKYPVTVAQYELFLNDDGYQDSEYWTQMGWRWRAEKNIIQPEYWGDVQWHIPDHPIVGVSWYEAYAFTQWLSAKTGQNISLPTEQQWQRATERDQKFAHLWGNEWNRPRYNNTA